MTTDKMLFSALAIMGVVLVVAASRGNDGAAAAPALPDGTTPAGALPEGHPPIQAPATAAPGPSGTVLETMDGGGYTYARLQTDEGEMWVAGPPTPLEVGESVSLSGAMAMGAFTSKALGRDFENLTFTNAFVRR